MGHAYGGGVFLEEVLREKIHTSRVVFQRADKV